MFGLAVVALWLAGCSEAPSAIGELNLRPDAGSPEIAGSKAGGQPLAQPLPMALQNDGLPAAKPHYVGSEACAQCHQAQYDAWRSSHHQRAMQRPTPTTVAGNFQDAILQRIDGQTGFLNQNGRYLIHTDGSDGERRGFEVRYTFGVEPLQQYLLALPGGRLQASRAAWDGVDGKWFDLRPGERIGHGDMLHWTGAGYNWNSMCADCHSTAVTKGYDGARRTYQTEFAELSVGCEACHGSGAAHVSGGRGPGSWAGLVSLADQEAQINICAPCHSRRSQLTEGFTPARSYFDHYSPALLDAGLYHADGQILDEVYVYGSFLQSAMHEAGVTCGHCHEPHSGELRAQGDDLCTSCHNLAGRPGFPSLPLGQYDSPKHHLHQPGSAGARCVNCHMPGRTYMVIDHRRDHSFRLPRPDLSAATGAPDACTNCHADRQPTWAAAVLEEAFGAATEGHFGPVFSAARSGLATAESPLAAIGMDLQQPAMVRATAMALMANYDRGVSGLALEKGLNDAHPLVRIGALRGAAGWRPMRRWRLAGQLLNDDLLAVRIEAVPLLAPVLHDLSGSRRTLLEAAIEEYLDVQAFSGDQPQAHTNIGNLRLATGETELAEAAFKTALQLNPSWVPALVNLADVYRAIGRDEQGGSLLLRAAQEAPDSPDVLLSRAFWLVRQHRNTEAMPLLAEAVELAPNNPRYAYTYAVALHSAGRSEQALAVIDAALDVRPGDQQLLRTAHGIASERNMTEKMQAYRRRLEQ